MSNISYKASISKLNKQREELGLDFLYETKDCVYFCFDNDDVTYYLSEEFTSGLITVSDEHNNIYSGYRMLNLLKLKI